jgi:HEAT repeat protein
MVLRAVPEGAPLLTIRGDDPGSLADPWLELRLGLFALAKLKDLKAAETALLSGGKPRFDWWAATWTAMRLESPALRPVLMAGAASSDPVSRAYAARGLGALKDASAFDTLSGLLRDSDETVVINAIRALALLPDPRVGGVLSPLLRPQNVTVLGEVVRALSTLPPDRSLRPRMIALITHQDPTVRGAVLQMLARIDREDFALILSGMDPDPVWSVRAALATGLGDAGDEVSLNVLFGMLKDEDPRVLPAVLEALRKVRGADAIPTLKSHLQHADIVVRATAADGLAELKATGLSEPLATAYRAALSEPDADARVSLVAALQVQKDARAREVLAQAAEKDPSGWCASGRLRRSSSWARRLRRWDRRRWIGPCSTTARRWRPTHPRRAPRSTHRGLSSTPAMAGSRST